VYVDLLISNLVFTFSKIKNQFKFIESEFGKLKFKADL
ncbi:hypothetical protein BN863_21820, partial [Formosa agariphila KMM 3901]